MADTTRIAQVFQRLDRGEGVRVWDAAEYLARHDPEAKYSSPLKKWWHDQVFAAISFPSTGFRFVHRGGGVYKVEGQIPLEIPESPPLEPGWVAVPRLPGL